MPNSDDSELACHRLSVQAWMRKLDDALESAMRKRKSKRLQSLSRQQAQHRSIRSWDIGSGATAKSTGSAGWRLLK